VGGHDAWLADRAQRDSTHHDHDNGYYGDEEADAAWWEGFYEADEASPRSGYSDYRDGTVGSRGRASYGNRQLHWHNHNDAAEAEDEGPWDQWAEEAAQSGYFVDDDAIDGFFN
jgi:hypothetical protein